MSPTLKSLNIDVVGNSAMSVMETKIAAAGREDRDDAFFIADLSDVVRKYQTWTQMLPRVHPYYAVKCNEDPAVLSTLAELGTGFDCASKGELQRMLSMKVSPQRIIYANPCKQSSHIKYAAKHQVARMTFDNELELHKVKGIYPSAKLVLRILPPEAKAQCPLGMKFGCPLKQVPQLLQTARDLDLDVIGISFHVGSGCQDVTAFSAAVATARMAFDLGKEAGFDFTLLDIGGGFPGYDDEHITFAEICDDLVPALDQYFPEGSGVDIIAEPGRYFVASAFTLAVNIIAKRAVPRDKAAGKQLTANDQPAFMYYVNDGVYGSFSGLLFEGAKVTATVLLDRAAGVEYPSSVWGPTCDGLDCILENVSLPELHHRDWIIFANMGAYTICSASNFNGFPRPHVYYMALEDGEWLDLGLDSTSLLSAAKRCSSGTLRWQSCHCILSEA